jgi:hypothetical protein
MKPLDRVKGLGPGFSRPPLSGNRLWTRRASGTVGALQSLLAWAAWNAAKAARKRSGREGAFEYARRASRRIRNSCLRTVGVCLWSATTCPSSCEMAATTTPPTSPTSAVPDSGRPPFSSTSRRRARASASLASRTTYAWAGTCCSSLDGRSGGSPRRFVLLWTNLRRPRFLPGFRTATARRTGSNDENCSVDRAARPYCSLRSCHSDAPLSAGYWVGDVAGERRGRSASV